jgi:putative hydrolase
VTPPATEPPTLAALGLVPFDSTGTAAGAISPSSAIARIVYLLDRMLAPSQKVRAFQRADEIVREHGDDEIRALVASGHLEDLPGIGKSTGAVITQAVRGEVPDYLAKLERDSVIPLAEGAEPYRAALQGDCHLHSEWSDGGAPIETMARTAINLGHRYMVLTDHSPRLTVAHGLNRERLFQQLDVIAELNERLAPFRILTGIEVDINEDGSLDHDDDVLARLDVVVASVHSKLRMDRDEMTKRMILAMASPHTDILGHCTGRKLSSSGEQPKSDSTPKRPQSDFDADLVFAACARFDKAVEINCRPERQDPPDDLLELALEWECKISIDTDAHAPGQLEFQNYGCEKAARHEIDLDRIVNTWDADRLVAWAASHAA